MLWLLYETLVYPLFTNNRKGTMKIEYTITSDLNPKKYVYEINEKQFPEYIEFIKSGQTKCDIFQGNVRNHACDYCPFFNMGTIPTYTHCLDKPFFHRDINLKIRILDDKMSLFD